MQILSAGVALFVLLGLPVLLLVTTDKDTPVGMKLVQFFGLVISIIPIIGLIQWLIFRGKPHQYGRNCGVMALAGIVSFLLRKVLVGGV
jgi:hypothetical protein